MSVTQPALRPRTVGTTVGRRLVSTISLFTVGPVSPRRGRKRILIPAFIVVAAGLLVRLLWSDLPGLYLVSGGAGPAKHAASPLTVPFRTLLGILLLTGFAALFEPEVRRWARGRGRSRGGACPPRLTRVASSVGGVGRRRGAYGLWPVQQSGRLLGGPHATPRRTVSRGFHSVRGTHGRHDDAVHHAHLDPTPGAARGHAPYGGRRRPGGGGLPLLSEPGAGHRTAGRVAAPGGRGMVHGGRGGSLPISEAQHRAETLALSLLTGYLGLAVIGLSAALNAGMPPRETLRGFVIAVALALPALVPILLHQENATRELSR